ncbi:Z-ring associated protein ZapG [Vibrio mexicanus]|uniref:Z-ring associated protein ZapG n=1 Tax=Vibrio mexicanus TaxID=1004326 RepID=UPI00063CEA77|nr:Z-ring associated protein ZapG [Vibrio mexicanus]
MPWIYALVGLLVGTVLGVVIARISNPEYKKQKTVKKDLEAAKYELEQQRQDLSDHFAQTAEMLDTLGKDYTKLYQHMAKTSSELLPEQPAQDNPFAKKIAQHNLDESEVQVEQPKMEEAPKDYANGATGLLKEDKKEIIQPADVVTAKAS